MKFNKIISTFLAVAFLACPLYSCSKTESSEINETHPATSEDYFADIQNVIDSIYSPAEDNMYVVDQDQISSVLGDIDMSYYSKVYAYSETDGGVDRIFIGIAKGANELALAEDELNAVPGKLFTSPEAVSDSTPKLYKSGNFICFVIRKDSADIIKTVASAIDYSKKLVERDEIEERIANIIDGSKANEAKAENSDEKTFGAFVSAIKENYTPEENGMFEIKAEAISGNFENINTENFSNIYACRETEYPNIDRILVAVAKDAEALKNAEAELNAVPDKLVDIYESYDADAAKKAKNYKIHKDGLVICFVISDNCKDIVETISESK